MEIKFFDPDFYDFILRYGFNLIIAFLLLKFIYRADKKNKIMHSLFMSSIH